MNRARVISEFSSAGEAKRVEETVKTGYVDAVAETLAQWLAAEEDLAESYGKLSVAEVGSAAGKVFSDLSLGSKACIPQISQLLQTIKDLDAERVKRIESLRPLA